MSHQQCACRPFSNVRGADCDRHKGRAPNATGVEKRDAGVAEIGPDAPDRQREIPRWAWKTAKTRGSEAASDVWFQRSGVDGEDAVFIELVRAGPSDAASAPARGARRLELRLRYLGPHRARSRRRNQHRARGARNRGQEASAAPGRRGQSSGNRAPNQPATGPPALSEVRASERSRLRSIVHWLEPARRDNSGLSCSLARGLTSTSPCVSCA